MSFPNTSQEKTLKLEDYTHNLFAFLDEVFESHHGIFLDKGTSLFPTLETVSAEEASIPVGGRCATLAAQVAHVPYYLEVLERYVVYNDRSPADWGLVWRTVEKVTPEEWDDYKRKLKDAHRRIEKMFRENNVWNHDAVGGSMAIVAHTAYHLGEIRQALCTLKG